MMPRKFKIERDAKFFKYKLLQIIFLLAVSLIIYLVYTVFDLKRFDGNNNIPQKPLDKEDLRPQNIFKKYISIEQKKEDSQDPVKK